MVRTVICLDSVLSLPFPHIALCTSTLLLFNMPWFDIADRAVSTGINVMLSALITPYTPSLRVDRRRLLCPFGGLAARTHSNITSILPASHFLQLHYMKYVPISQ